MYMGLSFLGVQSESIDENEKKISFLKNCWLTICILRIFNGQSPYVLKHVIMTFNCHTFSVHLIEKFCHLFLLQEKWVFAFY